MSLVAQFLRALFGRKSPKAPKVKGKLVTLSDGKRHRVDAEGKIIGKAAQRRYNQALRRAQKAHDEKTLSGF